MKSLIWWSNLTFKWSDLTLGWSDLAMVRSNCNVISDMVRLLLSLVAQTARVYLCFPLGAHVWWGYWSTRGYPPLFLGEWRLTPHPLVKGYLPSLSEGRIIPPNWRETYPPLPGDGRPCKSWVFCSITQPNDPPWVQTLTPPLKSTTQNIPPLHLPHWKVKKISWLKNGWPLKMPLFIQTKYCKIC